MTDINAYQPPESVFETFKSTDTDVQRRHPSGLGGWLIIVAIGLVVSPIRLSLSFLQTFASLFQDGTWARLTTPGSEKFHVLWGPLLVFEIVSNFIFIVGFTLLAFIFFRKSKLFPKTYIAIVLVNFCFIVFDAWFASFVLPDEPIFDVETTNEIVRSFVHVAVWVPYMLVSKRVGNTFVK